MGVGAQFKALAAWHAATGAWVGEVAEGQRAGGVVAHQAGADLPGGVVQAQFVVAFAVQFLAADRAEGLELRQFVRRAVDGVVAAANDHGLVGIAVEKTDQHFLTDAGQGDVAPAGTGPVVGDAHPAGAAVVILALAIPGELQAHATVFVAVDFFAGRADHGGDLRAVDAGFVT
ncbi:hypothetical protein D3C78_963530 [compost metagenome]